MPGQEEEGDAGEGEEAAEQCSGTLAEVSAPKTIAWADRWSCSCRQLVVRVQVKVATGGSP